MVSGASDVGVMAADSGVEGVRQEDMFEEEETQRLAAALGSRSTVSKCKVEQSLRHKFDTKPSACAHGDDSASDGHFVRGDECKDDHGRDGGDVVQEMLSGWRT